MSENIFVETELEGAEVFVATAFLQAARSQVPTTFTYSDEYLASRRVYPNDPALPPSTAPFNVPGLPGAFEDCARPMVTSCSESAISQGRALLLKRTR